MGRTSSLGANRPRKDRIALVGIKHHHGGFFGHAVSAFVSSGYPSHKSDSLKGTGVCLGYAQGLPT